MLTPRLVGGGRVLLHPEDDHVPATSTVLDVPVPDVEAAVDALAGRGVRLERWTVTGAIRADPGDEPLMTTDQRARRVTGGRQVPVNPRARWIGRQR